MKSASLPRKIKSYLLGKTIGKGAFGKVIQAIHLPTNQYVAIKTFNLKNFKSKQEMNRILREIEIMNLVDHPNIIQIYQVIKTKSYLYLVMEYAERGDLYQYIINNRKFTLKQSRRIFLQLVQCIKYLHTIGIIHRDIKPENIFLDEHLNVKLGDFGFSRLFKNEQKLETPCGSLYYSAPQMIFQDKYDGRKTDVWSLGVVLYVMVCGYLPFESENIHSFYENLRNCSYVLPRGVNEDLKDLLGNIFVADPKKRYSIDKVLSHEFLSEKKMKRYQIKKQKPIIKQLVEKVFEEHINKKLTQTQGQRDKKDILREIESNSQTDNTTYYWLLLKKQLRKQKRTLFDIFTQKVESKSSSDYWSIDDSVESGNWIKRSIQRQRAYSTNQSNKMIKIKSDKKTSKSKQTRSRSTDSCQDSSRLANMLKRYSPFEQKKQKQKGSEKQSGKKDKKDKNDKRTENNSKNKIIQRSGKSIKKRVQSPDKAKSMASLIREQYQICI